MAKERKKILKGQTVLIPTACGKLYVSINFDGDIPFELMGRMGKTGGCVASHIEALGRMCSLALQYDAPPKEMIKHLEGIRCPNQKENGDSVTSCADAFAKALKMIVYPEELKEEPKKDHKPRPANE